MTTILAVAPSRWWPGATVATLACGHAAIRPTTPPLTAGAPFACAMCEDAAYRAAALGAPPAPEPPAVQRLRDACDV